MPQHSEATSFTTAVEQSTKALVWITCTILTMAFGRYALSTFEIKLVFDYVVQLWIERNLLLL